MSTGVRTVPIDVAMATSWLPRITAKVVVDPTSGCWEWQSTQSNGYGLIHVGERTPRLVHRLAWVAANGRDIPKGLTIDHLCRNRICCNPDHLEPVTIRENLLRADTLQARNAAKTHCPAGHELSGDNLEKRHLRRGWRGCLECRRYREATLRAARACVGLTQLQYAARYGQGIATAEAILREHAVEAS